MICDNVGAEDPGPGGPELIILIANFNSFPLVPRESFRLASHWTSSTHFRPLSSRPIRRWNLWEGRGVISSVITGS